MRTKDIIGRRATAVLDAPEETRASEKPWLRTEPPRPRREMVEDFADDADTTAFLRSAGKNRRIRKSLIPQTKWGRIGAGVGVAVVLGALGTAMWMTARFFTHDDRFRIATSQSIEIAGNSHVTRSQLLSIFGEDVERNIFHVPLTQRKADLERLPWVQHATVMRLLPNRIRVQVVERTPVAFVRQGSDIGMVDASGVLLDIPPDAPGNPNYSFPVVTGIKAAEPMSTRAPRMKLYERFLHDLDSGGEKVSSHVSEVDLSDPEDVKALIPEENIEVLVHFGQDQFLERYKKMQDHMAEWKQMYPRLSGVDMRYERQVVLQVPQGSATAAAQAAVAPVDAAAANTPAAKSAPAKDEVAKKAEAVAAVKHPASSPSHLSDDKTVAKMGHPASAAGHSDAHAAHVAAAVKPSAAKAADHVAHTASAKPAAAIPSTGNAKADAERAKRIAAIHAWMDKREQMRKASAAAHPTATSTTSPAAR
ncbi:MAG: FtsQ-type POTRA domain-containing protein [Acidobacteria bacterium]|nr:FtsQ-type POTRA domain-containing protein [Acidobacteriota bacterium]